MSAIDISKEAFETHTGKNAMQFPDDYNLWRRDQYRALLQQAVTQLEESARRINQLIGNMPSEERPPEV